MSRHHHLVRVQCSNKATTQTLSTVSVCWGYTTFLQSIYSTYLSLLLCKSTMGLDLFFWFVLCLPLNFAFLASTFYQVFGVSFSCHFKHFFFAKARYFVSMWLNSKRWFTFMLTIFSFDESKNFCFFYWIEGFDVVWLGSWLYQPLWCCISD